MDDFLTLLYEKFFAARHTIDELQKREIFRSECESCGTNDLDLHQRDLTIARFELAAWEEVISTYVQGYAIHTGTSAALPPNRGIAEIR